MLVHQIDCSDYRRVWNSFATFITLVIANLVFWYIIILVACEIEEAKDTGVNFSISWLDPTITNIEHIDARSWTEARSWSDVRVRSFLFSNGYTHTLYWA